MKRDEVTSLLMQHHFAPATARSLTAEMPAEAEPADYAKRLMDAGDDRHLDLPAPVIDWARDVRTAAAKVLPVDLQVTQDEIAHPVYLVRAGALSDEDKATLANLQPGGIVAIDEDPEFIQPVAPELPEGGTVTDMTPEEIARLDAMSASVVEIEPARQKRRSKKAATVA